MLLYSYGISFIKVDVLQERDCSLEQLVRRGAAKTQGTTAVCRGRIRENILQHFPNVFLDI